MLIIFIDKLLYASFSWTQLIIFWKQTHAFIYTIIKLMYCIDVAYILIFMWEISGLGFLFYILTVGQWEHAKNNV